MSLTYRKGKRFAIRSGHFAKNLRAQHEIREAALVIRLTSGMPSQPRKRPKGRTLNNPTHAHWNKVTPQMEQKLFRREQAIIRSIALNPTCQK